MGALVSQVRLLTRLYGKLEWFKSEFGYARLWIGEVQINEDSL